MYAVIEVHNAGKGEPPVPRFRSEYDVFVVPYEALGSTLQSYAEDMHPCQGSNLTITLQEWTAEQAEAFIEGL